jgi:hypothetical protein
MVVFENMKKSIPITIAFVIILILLTLSCYLFFGGKMNLDSLSFLGNFNRVWFISIILCIAAAILLAYS